MRLKKLTTASLVGAYLALIIGCNSGKGGGESSGQSGQLQGVARYAVVSDMKVGNDGYSRQLSARTSENGQSKDVAVSVDNGLGEIRVSGNSVRYKPERVYSKTSVPFLYKRERGAPNRPMPWYMSLSAAGERIQLVRELNQQVLDTDEVFLDAISTENKNLKAVLDQVSKSQVAINNLNSGVLRATQEKAELQKKREVLRDGLKSQKAKIQKDLGRETRRIDDMGETVDPANPQEIKLAKSGTELSKSQSEIDATEGEIRATEQEIKELSSDLTAKDETISVLQERLEDVDSDHARLLSIAGRRMGKVNQRFTVFNMRPAAVVASERNPVAYSITERKFLDSLDLQSAAMVAGSVIQPWVVALGVVDSVARRVIKKDGDTELTYMSVPVPYDHSDDDSNPAHTNRVQIVVSNNGKYEFHLNGEGITSTKDQQIDWAAVNEPTDELTQTIKADSEVLVSAIQANRDVKVAEYGGGTKQTSCPKPESVVITWTETQVSIEAKPSGATPIDHQFEWKIRKQGDTEGELVSVPFQVIESHRNATVKVAKSEILDGENDLLIEVATKCLACVGDSMNLTIPFVNSDTTGGGTPAGG